MLERAQHIFIISCLHDEATDSQLRQECPCSAHVNIARGVEVSLGGWYGLALACDAHQVAIGY